MNTKLRKENAITLVALIITIIILIILAAVTINSLTHDGLADMAIKGAENYDKAQTEEMNMLNEIDAMVKETLKNLDGGAQITWTTSSDNKKVPVPAGYTVSNAASEKSVDGGFVIKDRNQNEWVWVPVDTATYNCMFEENTSGIALDGETGVKTTKYSKGGIIDGINRTIPGDNSGYREPDILTNTNGDVSNYNQAGFNSLSDMATKLVSEYSTMADSIKKYGGFYIGRYELTENGSKSGVPLTNKNWYELYDKCKSLTVGNSGSMTRMIWRMPVGCNM